MGNQVKKMGKALMLVLAMLVCFNIGVMAQEIEATMAPDNVKEAETTKVAGETETTKHTGEVETTTKANETETTKPSGETETTTPSENNNGTNTTQPNVRILFVGNSSTYYNDMPQMVKGLAQADGVNVTIQALTAANYKLYQFADEKDTYGSQLISALKNYKWDYVILQDHREMIITDIAKTQTAIETLKPLIQSSGAKMLLYDTQADYIGRSFTATGYSYYLSHNEIQHYMIKGYYMMGNKYGAQVISSGVNFERCLKQFPDIKLYNADNIHPTPTGSYLAACTIYGTIFNTTALENKYLPESEYDSNGLLKKVTKEAALKMQAIADPRLTIDTSYVEVNKGFNSKVTATLIANEKNEIGIVRGLAWTSVGGDTLQIEVNTMPGKGILVLTGNLGDVMKESAQIALSYAKSVAKEYGVDSKFFKENDIHMHIPEGAVPKDGPSAGITMSTAIVSAIANIPVDRYLAMTGEVTLRGKVLPIGGLKEKLLAAKDAGMKKVLVPVKNKTDVEEFSTEITDRLKIVYVSEMTEVLKQALVK